MARGRMLNRSISDDKRVGELVAEAGTAAGIFFTWLIPYIDSAGRTHGDPGILAKVCPRLREVTYEVREEALRVADELGLLHWYESNGDKYVWFPGFVKNQTGLRREAPSHHPAPTPEQTAEWEARVELFRSRSGATPEQVRMNYRATPDQLRSKSRPIERKGIEENRKEEKGRPQEIRPVPVSSLDYARLGGMITDWGWAAVPYSANQREKAKAMAPFTLAEIMDAKAETEQATGRPNAGLLLSIIERARTDDPPAEDVDWDAVVAELEDNGDG